MIWTEMSNVILLHSVSVQQKMESWGNVGGMSGQKHWLICFVLFSVKKKRLQTALFNFSASS